MLAMQPSIDAWQVLNRSIGAPGAPELEVLASSCTLSGLGREPKGELEVEPVVDGSLVMLGERPSEARPPPSFCISCRSPALATASKMASFAPASDQPMNASASAAASLQ